MMAIKWARLLWAMGMVVPMAQAEAPGIRGTAMPEIEIIVDGKTVTATLEHSAAAEDFLSLLPLSLELEDYHHTEKISDLPRRLSTAGAPAGIDPEVGDITYFAPWGNLAIFYRDFGYAKGLVHLGRITSSIDPLIRQDSFSVTIRRKPTVP